MILLLGGSGYVGQSFRQEMERRGYEVLAPTRADWDYTQFPVLRTRLEKLRPEFVINAAGYTGKPNVDACEVARAETLQGNTLFPQSVAHACLTAGVPWGHVSSGCIYSGAWVVGNGKRRVEKDLTRPELRQGLTVDAAPARLRLEGFAESDPPNFSFRDGPCSFYSGTKALGEEAIHGVGQCYLWRLRIPFDEHDNARNYLSKVQRYSKVYDNYNSISHRGDFVKACLDLWEKKASYGIYNVTNPGWVTTKQVVEKVRDILALDRQFEFWESDEEFYRVAAKTPRSNCLLDTTKLTEAGVKIRPVEDALEDALRHWVPEGRGG